MDFFIADTHFGHKNIVAYTGRPSNYVGLIMANWKRMIRAEDTVYHLGDVSFLDRGRTTKMLGLLPGKKKLLRGNHDYHHGRQWFLSVGFEEIVTPPFIYREGLNSVIILTHAPLSMEKQRELVLLYSEKIIINIHGHIHEKNTDDFYEKLEKVIFCNISVEQTGMAPITLDEILNHLYTQKKISFLTL
jgi:calcineurin-like phosphoesterase family protein